jgi:hypothetical protein
VLANALGVTQRTIRDWKGRLASSSSATRVALRLARQGKQWRFDLPKERQEFMAYVRRLRQWASGFSRVPLTTSALQSTLLPDNPSDYRPHKANRFVGELVRDLGGDNANRAKEIEILRHAMVLKRSTSGNSDDSSGDSFVGLPFEDWRERVEYYVSMVPIVASRFQCSVKDFPLYWPLHLRERNQSVLSGKLVNYVAGPEAFNDSYQGPVNIERKELQPMTKAEIRTECARLDEVWPKTRHWQKAATSYRKGWELKTLASAACELLANGKHVTGVNLAPLLFRNPTVQSIWNLHQKHLRLRKQGVDIFCVRERCDYGKRGISLSEFRQRYGRKDILQAREKAEAACSTSITPARNKEAIYGQPAEGNEHAPEKDETGVGVRDERGEAVTNATEKDKDFVSPETALRVRRQFEQSQPEVDALTQEERREIEVALGRPLEDYMKKPFKEDFKPA